MNVARRNELRGSGRVASGERGETGKRERDRPSQLVREAGGGRDVLAGPPRPLKHTTALC